MSEDLIRALDRPTSPKAGKMSRIGERVRDEIVRLAETPNGRRLELKRVFREFDSDGNGTLDYGEVYEMMNGVRPRPKDPKSDKEEHEGDQEEGDNWADFELGLILLAMVI